jgi:hypothetical protein
MMHASTQMPQPMAVIPNAEIYAPSDTLTARALVPGDENAVVRLLERAEHALTHLVKNFDAWMGAESDRLLRAHGLYALDPSDGEARDQLYRAAHDIRANGTGFGFPMATRIAASLAGLLEAVDEPPELVVKRHVAAIRAVVREDVRGQSGSAVAVASELERMVRESIAFGPL